MQVNLIAAINRRCCIGKNGKLPWHDTEELRLFASKTVGHALLMGRRTYESVGSLPARTTYVVTRDPKWYKVGACVRNSVEAAIEDAKQKKFGILWICGGREIYEYCCSKRLVDEMHISWVQNDIEGDSYWDPPLDCSWKWDSSEVGTNFIHVVYKAK
jgi:dihydrofolate reductase